MIHLITKECSDGSGCTHEYLQPASSYNPMVHGRFLFRVMSEEGDTLQEIIIDEQVPAELKARPPESNIMVYPTPATINLGEN